LPVYPAAEFWESGMLRGLSFSIVLVAVVSGLIVWHGGSTNAVPDGPLLPESDKPVGETAASDQLKQRNQQLQLTRPEQLPDPGILPSSLQGATQSVRLAVDANGHFLPASDSLELFEFYLAGIGEEPLKTVLLRIHHDIAGQLEEPALSEARNLLKRYLDYRIALMKLPALDGADQAALQQRFQLTRQTRQQYFTEQEHQLFFSADEREDERMLAQLADPQSLSQIESAFRQDLSTEQRARRTEITRDGELYEQTEQLRIQGASDEQIFELRAAALGSAAATALAELDQQRADWNRRMNAYAQERQRILAAGLAPQDTQKAIEQLLTSNFSSTELVRARALSEQEDSGRL
jgi:lipase chaperone LimK